MEALGPSAGLRMLEKKFTMQDVLWGLCLRCFAGLREVTIAIGLLFQSVHTFLLVPLSCELHGFRRSALSAPAF